MTEIKKGETKISVVTADPARQKRIFINLRTLNKVIFSVIAVLGIAYIAGANDLTAKGFKLRDMKKQARSIENDNKSLEAEVTSLGSYGGIGEKIKTLGMVTVDKVLYVEAKDGAVAKK